MDLKEAKKLLFEMKNNCLIAAKYEDELRYRKAEAIETILQELDNLQKEKEELISEKTKLLLTDLPEANRLYDEENKRCMMFAIENNDLKEKLNNSISKDKIRDCLDDIEDYFENVSVPYEDIEFIKEKRKDLLKEE